MDTDNRIVQQRHLVEEVGLYFDKEGHQPIAGRILGLLLVMDKELFTFEEIIEELNISKSSASIVLRNLEIRGSIEYITLPGDRKKYYRVKTLDPFTLMDQFAQKLSAFKEMSDKIYQLKGDTESRNAVFLSEMSRVIDFFLGRLIHVKDQYKKL